MTKVPDRFVFHLNGEPVYNLCLVRAHIETFGGDFKKLLDADGMNAQIQREYFRLRSLLDQELGQDFSRSYARGEGDLWNSRLLKVIMGPLGGDYCHPVVVTPNHQIGMTHLEAVTRRLFGVISAQFTIYVFSGHSLVPYTPHGPIGKPYSLFD